MCATRRHSLPACRRPQTRHHAMVPRTENRSLRVRTLPIWRTGCESASAPRSSCVTNKAKDLSKSASSTMTISIASSRSSEYNSINFSMEPGEFREHSAARLLTNVEAASRLKAFVGLDGFVDEIIHVVDKRDDAETFHRVPTIAKLAQRIAAAAGQSTNIELANQRTKLGGNGPIMANAL